jgi:hypothetical protein
MWLLKIHHSFYQSPALLLVAISRITWVQPKMSPTQTTCLASAASAFLTSTYFKTGSKLSEFSGIVVSGRANQYSTKGLSSFRSLILNIRCSFQGRWPFSATQHLLEHCFSHSQSFRLTPPHQLWIPVHLWSWDMRSSSKHSTWTLIPWYLPTAIVCSCSSHISVVFWHLRIMNCRVQWYIVIRCVESHILSSTALMSLIIAWGCFLWWRVWGPMNSGLAYDWELSRAARLAPEERTLQGAALISLRWAWDGRLSSLIWYQRMRQWKELTCGRQWRLWLQWLKLSWRFVLCACSSLSEDNCWKARYRRIVVTQCTIRWNFRLM